MTTLRLKKYWQDDRRLRCLLIFVGVGLIAFWPFLIAYIFAHPAAKGSDGFEIIAVIPATLIALCLSLPALLLSFSKRTLRTCPWIALVAILANGWFYSDLRWNSGLIREWHCSSFWTLCW